MFEENVWNKIQQIKIKMQNFLESYTSIPISYLMIEASSC